MRILVRPIRADDIDLWFDFVGSLSQQTKFLRFHFFPGAMTQKDARHFCNVDYVNDLALIGEYIVDGQRKILVIARYFRLPRTDRAEMAIVVADAYQGVGIGSQVFQMLATVARDHGIDVFVAEVLAGNHQMLELFKKSGYDFTSTLCAGTYHLQIPLTVG